MLISISTLVPEMTLSIEIRFVKYIKAREYTGIYTCLLYTSIIEKNLNGDVNTPFRFTYFNPFKGKFIASFDGHEWDIPNGRTPAYIRSS